MVQINNSYLLGLYGVSSDMIGALSTGVSTAAAKPKDPTPPWSSSSTAPRANELVERALRGRSFIDLTGAQVDVKGASQDYRKLFALYQGLNTLHALASRMDTKGVSTFEQSQIERRFAAGMGQVSDFIGDLKLDNMDMARGTAAAVLKSSVGMKRPATDYVGAVIHEGASTDPVAAYQGNVQFNVRVQKSTTLSTGQVIVVGGPIDVSIDLNDMGTTPRTLANVNTFINDRLAAANIQTRFATERTPGQARTVTVGDKTVTLPATQDRFALKIKGSAMESVTFSTTSNADAVYVVQQANTGDAAKQQLLKFQSNDPAAGTPSAAQVRVGETHWADGRAFAMDMASAVETARAVQTGADGSVYVLADVDGTIAGQDIKGEQDVALLKYDSSGQLVFARTLGAAETASGYALAVNADGKVAVAGSVTGALDRGDDGLDGDKSDGFVSVFNADGEELWTARRGARSEDEAMAVAFGADGSVYVSGRARSAVPGGSAIGGWDSYVQGFGPPSAATVIATKTSIPQGVPKFGMQFGTAGEDRATQMTMDGNHLLVAGMENGHAVVRRYSLQASGAPTLVSSRDLGAIQGGDISGLSVQNGRVIVTGTTGNTALGGVATINTAHSGGSDAFVLALEGDLAASANDRLTYFGAAGADKGTSAAFANGDVWIGGTTPAATTVPETTTGSTGSSSGQIKNTEGFLARINPITGQVEWQTRFAGPGNVAAPKAIAVAQGGASVLDRLGLPQGTIDQSDSGLVTAGTSARAGDKFYVQVGNTRKAVTIEVGDTLATLAKKIERASGFKARVTVAKDVVKEAKEDAPGTEIYGAMQRLKIEPRDDRAKVEISAGDLGLDALRGLGLEESVVRESPPVDDKDAEKVYGLALPTNLRLDSKENIKAAITALEKALATVRTAYRDLIAKGKPDTPAITGEAPAYLQAQVANYQAALDRLGG